MPHEKNKNGKKATNLNVLDWSKKVEDLGAGEIVLADINKDGSNLGLNIELANLISTKLSQPHIVDIDLTLKGIIYIYESNL